jgi:glycosyltransferase involved in cell wall biosynthesis
MSQSATDLSLPFVSVIVPAYNAAAFVEKTLTSILTQTYQNLEVVVIDDGSKDSTVEIVDRLVKTDRRILLFKQQNLGVAAARNRAIQLAKGELIAPIDADDIWYPQQLEKQVLRLLESPDSVGLIYSWSIDIDEQDQVTGGFHAAQIEGNVFQTLLCHNFLGNASATLIKKECFEKVGGYNHQLKAQNAQGCEDWDLYLRIAESYEFRAVPEFLVGYRKIQQSMSCNYECMARSHTLMLQSVREKHPEIPSFLYRLSSSSLYLYFAHQSRDWGDDRTTLFWLFQAIQIDRITPFLRLGWYRLLIKSWIGSSRPDRLQQPSKNDVIEIKVFLKVFVGNVLQMLLSRVGKSRQLGRSTPVSSQLTDRSSKGTL